jgi:hypothetical protein
MIWMKKSTKAVGFDNSKFEAWVSIAQRTFLQAASEWNRFTANWKQSPIKLMDDQHEQREILIRYLRKNDDIALIFLWFTFDPRVHIPDMSKPFSQWIKPTALLEFDHMGRFRKVSGTLFAYEGGESKSSYTSGTLITSSLLT